MPVLTLRRRRQFNASRHNRISSFSSRLTPFEPGVVYLPFYADADRLAFRHFGAERRERVDDRGSEFFAEFVASLGARASSCVVDFLFSDVGLLLSTDCASQRVNEDGIE